MSLDPAFGYEDLVLRDACGETLGRFQRYVERPEIAMVDADKTRFECLRTSKFGFIVYFCQHGHAQVVGGCV